MNVITTPTLGTLLITLVTTGTGCGTFPNCDEPGAKDSHGLCFGGDTGASEPDDENVPNYDACQERREAAGLPDVLFNELFKFEEYAAYAPSVNSIINLIEIPPPWHKGLPDMTEIGGGERSGLVGNFAFYNSLELPTTHPRPPIMYHLLKKLLNTNYLFRYNAYGEVCCILPKDGGANPNSDCVTTLLDRGVHATDGYPRLPGEDDYGASILAREEARCLSNDGEFQFPLAAQQAGSRNGLTWGNARVFTEVLDYIIQNFIQDLHPAVDWILQHGDLPNDVTFRWSEWGYTGECAFKAEVQHYPEGEYAPGTGWVEEGWYSQIECPNGYYAVLPDFDKNWEYEAEGFCAIEHWMFFLFQDNTSPEGPQDIYPWGEGMPNHYTMDLRQVPIETLDAWLRSIDLVESFDPDDSTPTLISYSTAGDQLLAKLDLRKGDRVISLAGMDLTHYDSLMREDVMDKIQQKVMEGHLIKAMIERGSIRTHRYIGVIPKVLNEERTP